MDNLNPCQLATLNSLDTSYETAIKENPDNCNTATDSRNKRSVARHTKFWTPGRLLRIRFLNGSLSFKEATKAALANWQPHVNLNFQYIEEGEAEIRISSEPGAYWSMIGTDALTVEDQTEATLKLSPDQDLSIKFFMAQATHEFGHMLGAEHEHLHPEMTIPWDKEAVYQHFDARSDLDRSRIDLTYFNLLDASEVNHSPYDPKSIMHYAIRQNWTKGDFQIHLNFVLSEKDKAFMTTAYPQSDA
ncbi:M12 family metallopeptidase [Pseudomonas sp. H1h]|uniref:M12 family metallopeptidase n=1 Tax=Pseudomonas sp. H1h TaxID=1397280 RepID=UPI00046892C8|nr:M12 family metallopeptidase [Pseudomonas sp. H1h]